MPSPVRYAVVEALLVKHGWALVRIAGSHHVFKKSGDRDWSIPVHKNKVKPEYVRQIQKHLGER